jgi:hypothetical protein
MVQKSQKYAMIKNSTKNLKICVRRAGTAELVSSSLVEPKVRGSNPKAFFFNNK